jgi:AraC-like DNA-binding protein
MSADALSDVLSTVRLTGATFFDVVAREPWVAEQPTPEMVLPKILAGADHLISYHVVTEGRCYAALLDGEALAVEAGEVVVFTRGDPHVLSSRPGMRADAFRAADLDIAMAAQRPFLVNRGANGPASRLVCGFLACDAHPFNPLLDQLPPVIKAGPSDGAGGILGQFIGFAVTEASEKRAGGESVLAKLSELMFIEVVRRYVERLPPQQKGWLGGLADPSVGRALSALHREPARDWTLEDLAREAGLSRSGLAERFTDLVGIPPIQYLGRWRMQIAGALLTGGQATMARIAEETGYASEAAFSRAFKKIVGMPPSAWRHRAS